MRLTMDLGSMLAWSVFDFLTWGYNKSHVYKVKVRDLQHLLERISASLHTIIQQCCGVCSGALRRDGNSVSIWGTVMSKGSDFVQLLCLL